MKISRISRKMPVNLLFFSLGLFLLAGCGSTTTGNTTTTTATVSVNSATATACAKATRTVSSFRTTIGTIASINGQTLVLTSVQGSSVTVTYSSSTRFTQETNIPATSLAEGTAVRVAVTSDGDTYDATTITLVTAGNNTGFGRGNGNGTPGTGNGTPGAGNGGQFRNNPCFNAGQFGTPRAGAGTGTANGSSTFRGLTGTVSQLSGDVLTISDTTGTSYTVNITAKTQIVKTASVTSTALKVGEPLTITGTKSSQGTVVANAIAILLSLPTRTPTGTPAP